MSIIATEVRLTTYSSSEDGIGQEETGEHTLGACIPVLDSEPYRGAE